MHPLGPLYAFVNENFWRLLALLLLTFTAGTFLWFSNDSSERYFHQYYFDHSPVDLPWWQLELAAGDELELPIPPHAPVPDGHWFLEVLGHPIRSDRGGILEIAGEEHRVSPSPGPRWHRVHLAGDPGLVADSLTLTYRPERLDAADARFRIWGRSLPRGPSPRLKSHGVPKPLFADLPEPTSLRRDNVQPAHLFKWSARHRKHPVPAPFFRLGVRTGSRSTKSAGSALIAIAATSIALLLLVRFASYCARYPGMGLSVLAISAAAGWLRYSHLSALSDLTELTGNGFTIRDWVTFDSACYLANAVSIYSNEPVARLLRPIGMPTFSAYLFQWTGVALPPVKLGFVVLQTLVGPLLFFSCLPAVRNKLLALIPLVAWSVFFRPMKYSYYYLTESLAMCLMIAWIAILYSRNPRTRDPQWFWVVASSSILFGLASYTRDVVVVFLPAFLGMVMVFVGPRWRQRSISAACALGIVAALWCATPALFVNKNFSLSPFEMLPISPAHYGTHNRFHEGDSRSAIPPAEREHALGLGPTLRSIIERASTAPAAYLGERYAEAKRFWDPELRWNQAGRNDEPAYRNGLLSRLVEKELDRGAVYAVFLSLILSTAVFGLFFSLRWSALAGLFLYFTLFHVLLFPGFTSRPKAIFFPLIVLFASTGTFALIEDFVPWLRRKRSSLS